MKRLSELEKHEIGDVHYVVYGSQAYCEQPVLHPLGRRSDLDIPYGDAHIPRSSVGVENLDVKSVSGAFAESVHRGSYKFAGDTAKLHPGVEVARDAPV